jgi:sortase (surface protein transpeptidase)
VRNRTIAVATAVLAVAGLLVSLTAALGAILAAPEPRPDRSVTRIVEPGPSAAPARASVPDRADAPRAAAPRSAAKPPRPVRVEVPSAGIDSAVRPVGVAADGQMALPADPAVLGWYRYGPAPGAAEGSVVLAGHLDSRRYGLGPLVGLREVEPGDTVRVGSRDGTRRYTVVDVRRYDRQALPEELFSRSGKERLRIITCGGEYLPEEGGYQQNLVVTAVQR